MGRQKAEEGKHVPRSVYVSCSAIIDNKLIHDTIHCLLANRESLKEDILKEAEDIFKEKYGLVPEYLHGPFYEWKGAYNQQKPGFQNKQIADTTNWEYAVGKKATATYKNWTVQVRFFKDHDDIAFVIFNKSLEGKKYAPKAEATYISELTNLQYLV